MKDLYLRRMVSELIGVNHQMVKGCLALKERVAALEKTVDNLKERADFPT